MTSGPLEGVKILELGQVIAGPLACTLLGDFGADVIHVEKPGEGDPMRVAGDSDAQGRYVWWKVMMRNKRSVTLDISDARTRTVIERLLRWADAVVENFRPGTLERWGFGDAEMTRINPRLVILHVSGYGQVGSRRTLPGFGKVGEAMSGAVALTGFADAPPVHPGFSLGDTSTGLMGALAVMMALYRRDTAHDEQGEIIDLALFETVHRLIEWQIPAYDRLGIVPTRVGNRFPFWPAALANTYRTADDVWMTISCATPASVRRLVAMLALPTERFRTLEQQRDGSEELDAAAAAWVARANADEVFERCREADVVAARVYDVRDIVADPTYAERGDIVTVEDRDFGTLRQPAPVPHLLHRPGAVRRQAPTLGQDNDVVFREVLGLSAEEIARLGSEGLI